MAFKIISVGWNCQDWIDQTLRSVDEQTRTDWEIAVFYDGGDHGRKQIFEWVKPRSAKAQCCFNAEQHFAVRNQYEGILALNPEPEDIIVFLDLDGDQLAHPGVLQRLDDYYADNTLLTYGSYRPIPDPGTTTPAQPFPADVIAKSSYRQHFLRGGRCCFNHLRTMKGKVFNAIPPEYFKWPDGRWYDAGTDYLFMLAGLELAAERHKYINETLLFYNHANPHADNLSHPAVTNACVEDILRRSPLGRLP
jgi:hypothetical protein